MGNRLGLAMYVLYLITQHIIKFVFTILASCVNRSLLLDVLEYLRM
jgi:hypothetical protein